MVSYLCARFHNGEMAQGLTLSVFSSQAMDGSVAMFSLKGVPRPPVLTKRTEMAYMPQASTSEARISQSSSHRPACREMRSEIRTPTTAVTRMATGVRAWIIHSSPRTGVSDSILTRLGSVPTVVKKGR